MRMDSDDLRLWRLNRVGMRSGNELILRRTCVEQQAEIASGGTVASARPCVKHQRVAPALTFTLK